MKTAQHWIDRLDEVSSERDQENWVKAIQRDARKGMSRIKSENKRLKEILVMQHFRQNKRVTATPNDKLNHGGE
jgi:hypothetical protein